jgi:hypothetical protein
MGMDVLGKKPTDKRGEYFRNNIWWWKPLWNYCEEFHGDITANVENGYCNDGDGLDGDDALELSKRLFADIESGAATTYETEYRERLASLPTSECSYCKGTGIRSDTVGVDNGLPDKELEESVAIIVGRTHGWCNSCKGYGRVEHFATNYPFSVENVQEFAEFLSTCGGFEIF